MPNTELESSVTNAPAADAQKVEQGISTLKKLIAKTPAAEDAVERAVRAIMDTLVDPNSVVSDDLLSTLNGFISVLDRQLSDQVNRILHDENFQKVERAWRGLDHLVSNTRTDEMLKIKVLNISKQEVATSLRYFTGAKWEYSPLARKIFRDEYNTMMGQPFGCLVGDYYFDHTPAEVALLGQISTIAAACHAPFIAGAAPRLFGMDSWQELPNPQQLGPITDSAEYAAWRALRSSYSAMYLGLAMPRFMARGPYQEGQQNSAFVFHEDIGGNHERYCWANAAYATAANITRAQHRYGWCTQIVGVDSGGLVEDLPVHTYKTDDRGVDMKCPTEVAIDHSRDRELSDCGLMALVHRKNENSAVFMAAVSLKKPTVYQDNPDANSSEQLSTKLPYIFAVSRFAHYLQRMLVDKIGQQMEQGAIQDYLSKWVKGYVLANPKDATEKLRAERPLAGAEVTVTPDPDKPGVYSAKFALRPHFQLAKIDVTLSLVGRLPSQRQG